MNAYDPQPDHARWPDDAPPFRPVRDANGAPPLYEAPVSDWIRLHALRARGLMPVTIAEMNIAAEQKRCARFQALCARRREALGIVLPDDDRGLDAHRMARLRIGHLRYGGLGRNRYDAVGSCLRRLDEYWTRGGGNREHLVDVLNLIEIEWIAPNVGDAHEISCPHSWFLSTSSGGILLRGYLRTGCRGCLIDAFLVVEHEWYERVHPNVHWKTQDTGGHWSLRNGSQP